MPSPSLPPATEHRVSIAAPLSSSTGHAGGGKAGLSSASSPSLR